MPAIIIPARFGSHRFPGKPLAEVRGCTLIERVWRIAMAVRNCSRVLIATDDERILSQARVFGAEAVMTAFAANGTERTLDAVRGAAVDDDVIVNLQGDAVLTPPWIIEALIDEMAADPDAGIVTAAVRLDAAAVESLRAQKIENPASGTTVVFDERRNALYFSKIPVPFIRSGRDGAIHRHIGLYGFRRRSLEVYVSLPPTPLEVAEGLEQLRALEHGLPIRVVIVDYRGRSHGSVDAPADVAEIEAIIAREGELVDG